MPVDPNMDGSLVCGDVPLHELRLNLIGNKDLKYALVCNPAFISKLVAGFSTCADTFVRDPSNEAVLATLADHLVSLKMLCAFVSRLTKGPQTSAFLSALEPAAHALVSLLSKCPAIFTDQPVEGLVQAVSCDCLDLILMMSNLKPYAFDVGALVSYVSSVVSMRTNTSVQIRLLRLVPYILSLESCTSDEWVPLFSILLESAFTMATALIASHWSPLHESPGALYHMAFTSDRMPSLSLQLYLLDPSFDMPLLHDLVKRLAQIVAYADEHRLALLIRDEHGSESPTVIPVNLYFVLLMLLKDEQKMSIREAALNLIIAHLTHLELTHTEVSVMKDYDKLFPIIVSMLDLNTDSPKNETPLAFLKSPTCILAELCHRHQNIAKSIEIFNLDRKLMRRLEVTAANCKLLRAISVLKSKSERSSQLMDFEILLSFPRDDGPLADLLHLISIYSAESESMRSRTISCEKAEDSERPSSKPTMLCELLFEIVENYHFLQTQLILGHNALTHDNGPLVPRSDWGWLQSNLGIVFGLLNSPLTTSAFSLLRSLLRLVALLRTFFVRCDGLVAYYAKESDADSSGFIKTLLTVISVFAPTTEAVAVFHEAFPILATLDTQSRSIENLTLAISITANLILDFSSFRSQVVADLRLLPALFRLYLGSETRETLTGSQLMDQESIQLCVLQVLSNYMFNEITEAKCDLLKRFPLVNIIARSAYGMDRNSFDQDDTHIREIRIKQKLAAFVVLRNITASLPRMHARVVAAYQSYQRSHPFLPNAWHQYLVASMKSFYVFSNHQGSLASDKHMIGMMLSQPYTQLIESINYIENHRYTIPSKISALSFPATELLQVWLRILSLQPNRDQLAGYTADEVVTIITHLNAVKLGIVWILINLTWQCSTTVTYLPEHMPEPNHEDHDGDIQLPEVEMLDADEKTDEDSNSHDSASGQGTDTDHHDPSDDGNQTSLSDAQHRIDMLNRMGFGRVVGANIRSYNGQSLADSDEGEHAPAHRFDISNSHDLFEMLGNAQRQLQGDISTVHEDIARSPGHEEGEGDEGEILSGRAVNPSLDILERLVSDPLGRYARASPHEDVGGSRGEVADVEDDDGDNVNGNDSANDVDDEVLGMYVNSARARMARGQLMSDYGDGVYDAATIRAFEEAERETEEFYATHPEEREE